MPRMSGSRPVRIKAPQLLVFVLLGVGGAVAFFPFLLMLSTSFKPIDEIFEAGLRLLPQKIVLYNYEQVFAQSLLARYLLNGVIVTLLTLSGQLLVSVPAAYAFARFSFRGKKFLFAAVLAALVFPRYIAAVPTFLLLSRLRLIDTYAALVLPFVGSPFAIFLLRQYILQIPREFFDAAAIDGCTLAQVLRHILIALIRPAIGAFAIFSVVAHWNDFFWPLIAVRSPRMFTPPAGVVYFADATAGTTGTSWNVVMAAAVVIITPLIAAFLFARKQFVSSLTHAALKG